MPYANGRLTNREAGLLIWQKLYPQSPITQCVQTAEFYDRLGAHALFYREITRHDAHHIWCIWQREEQRYARESGRIDARPLDDWNVESLGHAGRQRYDRIVQAINDLSKEEAWTPS